MIGRHLIRLLAVLLFGGWAGAAALDTTAATATSIIVADGAVDAADDGQCSLVEAIDNANDVADGVADGPGHADCPAGDPAGADVIELPAGGSFALHQPAGTLDSWESGLPAITSAVTIQGSGATIGGGQAGLELMAFGVGPTGELTLEDLVLERFLWGVVNEGKLALNELTISHTALGVWNNGGVATVAAGRILENDTGIRNDGELTLLRATLSDNQGGLVNEGTVVMDDTHVTGSRGGGISNGGDMTIGGSVISDNDGGGIFNNGGQLTIVNSVISDNRSPASGAGISNFAVFFQPLGVGPAGPAGPPVTPAIVRIDFSIISGNESAAEGGGISNVGGNLSVWGSLIADNRAVAGGGIHNFDVFGSYGSSLSVSRSTIMGNRAERGGGLSTRELSSATIDTSTLTGNTATEQGGAVYRADGQLIINHSTVILNSAGQEGGGILSENILNQDYGLEMVGNLIAGNSAPAGPEVFSHDPDAYQGSLNLFGANGVGGTEGITLDPFDLVPQAPLGNIVDLRPKDHGGPALPGGGAPPTHALPWGSPAIDHYFTDLCDDGLGDQRLMYRPSGGDGNWSSIKECDAGAYEVQSPPWQYAYLGVVIRP
jgi:hypothetical protein